MPVNKVVYGGRTLIDLTSDTVNQSALLKGHTAHTKDGTQITGEFEDTSYYDEIKEILTNGLTETVIRLYKGTTLKVIKRSINDDNVHTTILIDQNGAEVGRTIKTFSNNSLLITTVDSFGRKLVETIDMRRNCTVAVLTRSDVQIGKVTINVTKPENTSDGMSTTTTYTYEI